MRVRCVDLQENVPRRSRSASSRCGELPSTWKRQCERGVGVVLAVATCSLPGVARAGGFELPDNGAQALGRGAAFVAKASDGTAIQYNPAGLARQRGTHLLLNGNLYLHSFQFQRLGTFPDDPQDAQTPWGNEAFPLVNNVSGPFFSPFIALTSDFGYFDRLTFAAGVFSPSAAGNRTFPLGVDGKPAASRYDFVQSLTTFVYPTVSAGLRVTKWLDVGISGHLVLANFNQTMVSYADLGSDLCADNAQGDTNLKEDFRCDSRNALLASGSSFAATLGAMIRPSSSFALGASFRTPTNISANGTLSPEAPRALPDEEAIRTGPAAFELQLPWMLRAGARYIGMDADFELYDLELDVTYEAWASAQGLGPILSATNLGTFNQIQAVIQHQYVDTFSVRAGGAYNIDAGNGIFSVRGGAYFDSSATDFSNTRLDYDTLTKIAGTFGLGFKLGSFSFDLGYAAVASIPRTVGSGNGQLRPVNIQREGGTLGDDGKLLPVVNEGSYRGFTHIVSLGVGVSFDSFFGSPRPIHYGNSYEPNYAGPPDDTAEKEEEEEEESEPSDSSDSDVEEKPSKPVEPERTEKPPEPQKPPEIKKPPVKPPPEIKKPPVKPPPPPPPEPEEEEEEDEEEEEEEEEEEVKPAPQAPPIKPAPKRKEWWEEPG